MAFNIGFSTLTSRKDILNVAKVLASVRVAQNLVGGQVLNRARYYPPERPNQKYVRTYSLRKGWRMIPSRKVGDRLEVDIVNNAVDHRPGRYYAGYVYGFNDAGQGQSIYHVGRWYTRGQLANRDSYARQVQNAINKVVD